MSVKVLHVITRMILGGAQENTLATVRILSEKDDYDVTLATGPPIGPEGSLMAEAEKTKAKIILIPEMRREINPLQDAVSLVKLYFLMLKGRYDIVHTHSSKAGILGRIAAKLAGDIVHTHSSKAGILGRIAAKLAGVKAIVHTIHGLPFHPYQSRFLNLTYVTLEKLAALITGRIVTVCDAMSEKAVRARVAGTDKFETIYSGMNLQPFLRTENASPAKRRDLGIEENEIVVGKIGRLFPLKGHKYLIESAPAVVKAFPNVKFLLIGDGILKEELKSEVRRLGLESRFIFSGLAKREEIPGLISVMDILVHTSVREGLARVLPQALACGKPAISFDIDGAREVVIQGKTGFLVPPEDTSALSKAIIDALSDIPKLKEMGQTGRSLVAPVFSAETMVDKIDALYRNLLHKKQSEYSVDRVSF
jgi:glycosyltransferase involved in cell wall biosynthesis